MFMIEDVTSPDDLYIAMFKCPEDSAAECLTKQSPYDPDEPDFQENGFWYQVARGLGEIVSEAQQSHKCKNVDRCMLPYLEPTDILSHVAELDPMMFRNRVNIMGNIGGIDVASFLDTGAQFNVMHARLAKYLVEMGFKTRPSKKRATSFNGGSIPISGEISVPVLVGPSISLQKFVVVEHAPAMVTLGQPYMLTTRSLIRNDLRCVDIQSTICPKTYGSVPWLTAIQTAQEAVETRVMEKVPRFISHIVTNTQGNRTMLPKTIAWFRVRIPGSQASFSALITPNPFYLNPNGLVLHTSVSYVVKGECFIRVANTLNEAVHLNAMDVLATIEMIDDGGADEILSLNSLDELTPEIVSTFKATDVVARPDAWIPDHCVPPSEFGTEELDRTSDLENIERHSQVTPMLTYAGVGLDTRVDLNEDQKDQILTLMNKYRHIFTSDTVKLGRVKIVQHSVDTGEAKPIKQRAYVVAQAIRTEIDKQIQSMLDCGVITQSNSPWASPVVVVPKKGGAFRFCIDYRKLNNVTVKDVYPLPRIQEVMDRIGGSQWISTFDMANGYWQIAMDKRDQHKTAFICHAGLFEWTVMPFGLTNAPATFQRLTEAIFAGVAYRQPYFDDIMIFSKNFVDHLAHLEDTFLQCHRTGVVFKTSKSEVAKKEVTLLGFIAGVNGVRTDPSKVTAIQHFPRPKNSKHI